MIDMATPPNDDTKMLFRLLSDREWHSYLEVRDAIARTVGPGRAVRKYKQDLLHSRKAHQTTPDLESRKSQDEMILIGQRSCAQVTITSWKRANAILQRGQNQHREIMVRPGFTSWGIPGFEPQPNQPDSAQEAGGYTDLPPEDSEPSEPSPETRTMADEFATLDVTRAVPAPAPEPVREVEPEPEAEPEPEPEPEPVPQIVRESVIEPGTGLDRMAPTDWVMPHPALVRLEAEGRRQADLTERYPPFASLGNAPLPNSGSAAVEAALGTCELCGLTVANQGLHDQWHAEHAQADTPSDVALLNESQLRDLIRTEMANLLDQFQEGVQGYLEGQFAQLEEQISASRKIPNRWIKNDA